MNAPQQACTQRCNISAVTVRLSWLSVPLQQSAAAVHVPRARRDFALPPHVHSYTGSLEKLPILVTIARGTRERESWSRGRCVADARRHGNHTALAVSPTGLGTRRRVTQVGKAPLRNSIRPRRSLR